MHRNVTTTGQAGDTVTPSEFISSIGIINVWTGLLGLATLLLIGMLFSGRRIEASRPTLLLLGIALVAGFTGIYAGKGQYQPQVQSEHPILKTYGPGMGPLHMAGFYKSKFNPEQARFVQDIVHDPSNVPPPIQRDYPRTVHITLEAEERVAPLTANSTYYYWTYNGTVPGPILRVREGDTIVLTLRNEKQSTHNHSIDLHAVNGPGGGAVMTQVPPGSSKTIRFKALNPGFYVYHCGSDNIPTHIANQMFGGIIVEPKGGLPPVDEQFVVFQGEIYANGSMGATGYQAFAPRKLLREEPTYYTFNGRPHGITGKHRLDAAVGDLVRIYFGNMGNAKISSFHVIGEQFTRYWPHGAFNITAQGPGVQTVPVAAGSSAVVDLKINAPGNYVLVDHALARLDRGAWGILQAEGRKQPSVFTGMKEE
ncbi:MAG: multicopper oxidase domain-containing protein [Candidatus Nanohaloarchaea archaeon]|nr:multicopper oxidase domain-containing protein [Candidatus Nanohaloarchaea archaeon]